MTNVSSLKEVEVAALPLSGIMVLDLSRALAGPYCAQTLSDLGAEVIKIEQPTRPDEMREWPPFDGDLSTYFAITNRNKRCLTLNLKQQSGRDLLMRLVAQADVVIENYRYGVTKELGISYEDLRRANEKIVLCSIRGYGKGANENRPAYDAAIQAFTGIMSVTGDPAGDVQRAGVALVDFSSGLQAACGVLAAIRKRDLEHKGTHVEVTLVDSGINAMAFHLVTHLMTGRVIARSGTSHPAMVPCKVFNAADNRGILIVVANNTQFTALCGVLNHPEWVTDERYRSPKGRVDHRDEVDNLLQAEIAKRNRSEWLIEFEREGVPFSPVNGVDDLAADPVFTERMLGTIEYEGKELKLVRSPIQLDGEVLPIRSAPPRHGEHTDAVLAELGLNSPEIDQLRRAGTI